MMNIKENLNQVDYTGGYVESSISSLVIGSGRDSVTVLPSAKEFREAAEKSAFQFTAQWSEPKYQCPKCDGGMCRNEMKVLTSYPPKYEYQCNKCGHIEYQYM